MIGGPTRVAHPFEVKDPRDSRKMVDPGRMQDLLKCRSGTPQSHCRYSKLPCAYRGQEPALYSRM